MADNVQSEAVVTPGPTWATDEDTANSRHIPYTKLMFGADGTFTILDTTNALPVDLRTDNLAGNLDVNLAASTVDVMLGTDFSSVFGSASLIATDGSAALTIGTHVLGTDGTNAQILSTNTSGHVNIADGGNDISVDWAGTAPPIGAGTEAAALRVTVATDSTGVLTVDNAGTFAVQVDAALPAGTNNLGKIQLTDGTSDATIRNLAANDALNVAIVDAAGDQITTFGGGTQYAEDAPHASGNTGTMALGVRQDTPGNLSGLDGDYEPFQVSAGRMWVSAIVDAALPAGTNAIGKLAANSGVDIGDVDILSVTPGFGATNLGKREDDPHASLDVGVMTLAVRTETAANKSGANGDYEPLQIFDGRLWVQSETEYNEDTPHTTGDRGNMVLAVQQTADAALAGLTGDYAPLQVDETGYLKVNVKAGGGVGGTSSTDDAAFTAGSGSGTPMMGFATADTVEANDVGVVAMNTSRALHVSIQEDGVGIGGGTQYAVNDPLGATPTGTLSLAKRDDALSALGPAADDAVELRVDANGALWVVHSGDISIADGGNSITVDNGGTFAVQAAVDELPAAAPLTDNFTNPTTTSVAAMGMVWDGVTWDRLPGDATNGVTVNLGANNDITGTVTANAGTGTFSVDWNGTAPPIGPGVEATALRVTVANDSTGVVSVDDNGGNLSVDWAGTVPPIGSGTEAAALRVTVATDSTGVLSVDDNGGSISVDQSPATSGGYTISRTLSAATTNATSVKGSAGQIFGWFFSNSNAAARYIKFYNKATAPTVGTDTPVITLEVPAGVAGHCEFLGGIEFGTGIGFAMTTGVADADTGAVAANEVILNLFYK